MKLWLKLAFKEIKNNRRFSLFFMLNLTLGLVGFIALDSFKTSIQQHLENNSKSILTADISVSSNQPFTAEELQIFDDVIGDEATVSNQIRFFSMVAGKNYSRLVQIFGIDEHFPLYGKIVLEETGLVQPQDTKARLLSSNSIWASEALLLALEVERGQSLKIGTPLFKIDDMILEDPSGLASTFSGLPTVYMGLDQIEVTGLVQQGSRIRYQRFYKLPRGMDFQAVSKQLRDELEILYSGSISQVRVTTHKQASRQLGRILGYLNDYLGLVALIALFLAGVGAAYLFRSFLTHRFKEMAILISLGATRKDAYQMTLVQITVLGLASAIFASILAYLVLPLIPIVLQGFLPKGFTSSMGWNSLFLALFMGSMGSVICCLPILSRIYNLNPIALFHEEILPESNNRPHLLITVSSYIPGLAVYWILAIWQSNSWIVGSLFIGIFLGAILILGMIAWAILILCGKLSHHSNVTQKIALRNLYRNKLGAISCFLAIGLGALLINLIPQIQQGLQEEISRPTNVKVPSFFLFDIQSEQVNALKKYLAEEKYQLSYISPMIRARLETVNHQPIYKKSDESAMTREQERDNHTRNRRSYNLSYRAKLSDSETIVAGVPFSSKYDFESGKLPEISVEQGFAERLDLKLGDEVTFDVQSVPITGKIVNFRRVKWNSFQPNFFIMFQPGVLEEAPTTFLAGISNVDKLRKVALQNGIVNQFPNISVIDVSRVVNQILSITDQISWAIQVMAYLSILVGLVVLFSIAQYEIQNRFWEINLLKVLGARFQDVRSIVLVEFGILGFFAALFGVLLSHLMSFFISMYLFENIWSYSWPMTVFSIIGICLLSVVTALVATTHILKQKPLELLKAT